jgi:YHS domain-containing protein/thioredoxin-like negative regulator of GroEL
MLAKQAVCLAGAVLLTVSALSFAQQPVEQGLQWETSLAKAPRLAAQTNRLLLVHFGAPWCPPCQRLEQEVFNQPGFGKTLENQYVPVKLNYDQYQALAQQYGVKSIPADLILTPEGKLVQLVLSPASAAAYVAGLQTIAGNYRAQNPAMIAGQALPAGAVPPATVPVGQPPVAADPNAIAAGGMPPTAQQPPAQQQAAAYTAPSDPVASNDRYASYYNRGSSPEQAQIAPAYAAQTPPPAAATQPQTPVADPNAVAAAAQYAPPAAVPASAPAAPYATSPNPQPATVPVSSMTQQPAYPPGVDVAANQQTATPPVAATPAEQPVRLPPGSPPLALEGYCPVTLAEKFEWNRGDPRWGAMHRNRTYLFCGPEQQQRFMANPDQYSPVMSGDDPVISLEQGQSVPGSRNFGIFCDGRIYLFSSEASLLKFSQNPKQYTAAVQNMQTRR